MLQLFPSTVVVDNPLGDSLSGKRQSVFEAVRRAYLDDLIFKEGVSELPTNLKRGIRPTPEVVNRGFQEAMANRSTIGIFGPCLLLDIGGATTDLHYTTEVVRDDSPERPLEGTSVGRHVFTDLGIVASRDTLLLQMRAHPRLYEFLSVVCASDSQEIYRNVREGTHDASAQLLSYACMFLAADRFAEGRGPGLPTADLSRIAQVILTGGAAQTLEETVAARVLKLLLVDVETIPVVTIDRQYQLWIDGILCLGPVAGER